MRRFDLLVPAAALLVIFGGVTACGEAPEGEEATEGEEVEMPFDVATAGDVQGMVMFEGDAPAPQPLDMASEPECEEHWDGEAMREEVQVADGHLADVFVYVKEGLEDMTFPAERESTLIDQRGCRYAPTVSGAMTGQTVVFRNSDPVMHNINSTPSINRGFNFSQPAQDMENEREFAQPEVMIPIRCDVHGWMQAYLGVVPHPYHAVSGEGGSFDLSELPPGEYVIEAWHAVLGTQEQTVTVETGETAEVSFTFNADMMETAVVPMGEPIDPHGHHPDAHSGLHRTGSPGAATTDQPTSAPRDR